MQALSNLGWSQCWPALSSGLDYRPLEVPANLSYPVVLWFGPLGEHKMEPAIVHSSCNNTIIKSMEGRNEWVEREKILVQHDMRSNSECRNWCKNTSLPWIIFYWFGLVGVFLVWFLFLVWFFFSLFKESIFLEEKKDRRKTVVAEYYTGIKMGLYFCESWEKIAEGNDNGDGCERAMQHICSICIR